ncbi:hypothetical protein EON80_03280 [bacterium]|nr:MAG: hypothetical protein EON80_03280 [bacterium]
MSASATRRLEKAANNDMLTTGKALPESTEIVNRIRRRSDGQPLARPIGRSKGNRFHSVEKIGINPNSKY